MCTGGDRARPLGPARRVDPYLASRAKARLAYFSLYPQSPRIKDHPAHDLVVFFAEKVPGVAALVDFERQREAR